MIASRLPIIAISVVALVVSGCMPSQQGTRKKSKGTQVAVCDGADDCETGPGPGGVSPASAKNTELRLTLGTRWMVSSTLSDIFGGETALAGGERVRDAIKTFVLDQPASFGGPCDPYASSHPVPVKDARGNVNRTVERVSARGCSDATSSQAAILPSSSTSRLAWNTRACDRIVASDAAVRYAATQAGVASGTLESPSGAQVRAAYDLFYPGLELPSAAFGDLQAVTAKAASLGGGTEAWRFLLLALCLSPGWQVL